MAIRVAILGRVSGHQQKKEETIETQTAVCEAYCRKNGLEIFGRYLDLNVRSIVPAGARSECARLLRDAAAKRFDMVLVYAIDRLSRYRQVSDPFLRRLKDLGIGFDSATENMNLATDEGRVLYSAKVAFAELERDTIEQRMRDGKKRIAQEWWVGKDGQAYSYWLGGPRPYGYGVVQVNRRSVLVPSEEPMPDCQNSEAEVVRLIFTWATRDSMALQKIANRLNAMGIPKHSTLTGGLQEDGRWHYGNVSRIIHNPTYTGQFSCGDTPQRIPAIISQELFNETQRALKARQTYADRNANVSYLLRGKMTCGLCNTNCVGVPRYTRRDGKKERLPNGHYYVCDAKHQPGRYGRSCPNPHLPGAFVEELVWVDILDFVSRPGETRAYLKEQLLGTQHEQSSLRMKLDTLKRAADERTAALKTLRRKLAESVITDAQYQENRAEYQAELDQCCEQVYELEELLAKQVSVEDRLREAEGFLAGLELREDSTWEEKRRLVELLVDKIVLGPDGIEIDYWVSAADSAAFTLSSRRSPAPKSTAPGRSGRCWTERRHCASCPSPGQRPGTGTRPR
jgi:site-specific DNA recombinase